jgi:hypothetical protein
VNPAHLFLGTQADNNADKMTKGRHVALRGLDHPRAKLTAEIVLAICDDPLPPRRAAKKYGTVHSMIFDIRAGRRWGSVTGRHWKSRQERAGAGRQDQTTD